jgi:hypothetical protein
MRPTRLAAVALLFATQPACTTYRLLADPATELQEAPKPVNAARVTIRTGERLELDAPLVTGDSLRGFLLDGSMRSLALTDVTAVEVRRVSAGKTAGAVLGMVALSGIIAGGAKVANSDRLMPVH